MIWDDMRYQLSNRREFLSRTMKLAAGGTLLPFGRIMNLLFARSSGEASRLVIARDDSIDSSRINGDEIAGLLDRGMQAFFDKDRVTNCWKQVVNPGQIVGLKVNCLSGYGSTHPELVSVICERLKEAGIRPAQIVIWDRLNRDLESAGFRINENGPGVRCFGNDTAGFSENLEVFGSAGSRVSNIIGRMCDVVINIPVLKDHSIAGITGALKNMFGAIHNPNKYHLSNGNPYIADVNMLPSIKGKTRLIIMDAMDGQYEGGPSFMPHWRWPNNELIIGTDPVAVDRIAWSKIEAQRSHMGLKSLKESGREPKYIETAGNPDHVLGIAEIKRIKVVDSKPN